MKICDITQFYSPVGGGVRRYIQEKRNYILRHTQDEHLLLIPGAKTEIERQGRLTTCTIASPSISRTSRYRILLNLQRAAQIVIDYCPDIIECGDPYHLAWRMIHLSQEHRIPICGFYHSHFPEAYLRTLFKYFGSWLRHMGMLYAQDYIVRLYNHFDMTLVPSMFLRELLQSWGIERTVEINLGIDAQIFRPSSKKESDTFNRTSLGIPPNRLLLLYIGRLAGEKNTKTLLETFRLLHKLNPEAFSFLIIGDGLLRSMVQTLQKDIPFLKWISYCNDSQQLADYYRMADLFVHPGVCETFGLVSLEAQACGVPVIGIRGSYMDTQIAEGLEFWALQNTPQALCDAILEITQQDLKMLGLRASEVVRSHYSWENVFEHLWTCYRKTIAHHQYRRVAFSDMMA